MDRKFCFSQFLQGFGGARGKTTTKSVSESNFASDTPILRSVRPKIRENKTLDSTLDSTLDPTLDSTWISTLDASLDSTLESTLDSTLDLTLDSTLDLTLDSNLDLALDSTLDFCSLALRIF